MASAAGHRNPKCHVLNFFYDKDGSCALTVLFNSVRFHIIADARDFGAESGPGAKLAREYEQLLKAVKEQDNDFTRPCSKENLRSGSQESNDPDSGHGTSDEDELFDDKDSAVDVGKHKSSSKSSSKPSPLLQQAKEDPDKALNNWILSPFGPIFDDKAPATSSQDRLSVQEWYMRPTCFFSLKIQDDSLHAHEEEATSDLERRMADIVPKMYIPKYIREMQIPWYASKDVSVLDANDEPAPYHPSRVQVGEEIFFLKTVDPTQPAPTKREIKLMKKIESLGLHERIRVPLVKGLVGHEDSNTEMMGFLQTEIEDPTPLTKLLDDEVPQKKRDKWANESERMKDVLHENGIIWGDAKADNFMVDKHDNLWIIDFGGSYTDGWVDPELSETLEGDDMGVAKIVNALHDPNANTMDPEDDGAVPDRPVHEKDSSIEITASRKRSADKMEDDVDEAHSASGADEPSPRKRARKEQTRSRTVGIEDTDEVDDDDEGQQTDSDREQYCICNQPSSGDMVACDNDGCKRQWFHFKCVGLDQAPKAKHWYCDDCKTR